jgi:VWFA-related protein
VVKFISAPEDLATWAKQAAEQELPDRAELPGLEVLEIVFPDQLNQRIVARFQATIPADTVLETTFDADEEEPADPGSVAEDTGESADDAGRKRGPRRDRSKRPAAEEETENPQPTDVADDAEDAPESEESQEDADQEADQEAVLADEIENKKKQPKHVISVEGVIEQDGKVFEEFKVRFKIDPRTEAAPIALVFERLLRPDRSFVAHIRVRDDVAGSEAYLSRGFVVPKEPQIVEELAVPESSIIALGEQLQRTRIPGKDSLILVPPESDVVLNLWRAEALVTGERIQQVQFYVDDQRQLTRNSPPFTAEVRLAKFPTEQIIRAEGYDAGGELVASDELILNQPRGALGVTILEPRRGVAVSGATVARAEVVVPDGRTVDSVKFQVNDETVATLDAPPWQATIEVPPGGAVAYLTVAAMLDDGSQAEDVRFLNAPQYLEQVEVKLVELYTTVVDRNGRLIRDLAITDFEVFEDERPQTITKFELVDDLPLTIGITVDTSGSMVSSLPQAEKAAKDFLRSIMTEQDQAFAVSFANYPVLLIPPTDDVRAVEDALTDLQSLGWTTLHDAVVTSLYYFRGVRGRRAMVLLSDGDDTGSSIPYRDALEYARRSGVMVYSIGLDVGKANIKIRRKLTQLAEETGGQSFFIHEAAELSSVYKQIEEDLRSQYLLAYSSDRPASGGEFRTVSLKVQGGKLKARTISGYYP